MELESVAANVVNCAFEIHRELGPGLLESVYERLLADALERRGMFVLRQVPITVNIRGLHFEVGFRADLLVDEKLLVELKAVESNAAVHKRQVLTYLRLMNLPLGLLINFGCATFKEGVCRVVNNYEKSAALDAPVAQSSD